MAAEAAKLQIAGGSKSVGDEDLRQWLETYIAEHPHLTTNELSRSHHIGKSKTALDAYLNGTYFLSKEAGGHGVNPSKSDIEPSIREYREKVEGTVRHGYKNSFIETRSWMQLQHACKTAIEENVIIVVYGKPGVGKTRCLREFSNSRMSTLPIEILCSANITTRYFVQKIAQQLKVNDNLPTAKLEDVIAEKLKRSPRPIIVDQANYLNEKGLGAICYIWDLARVPFILSGTKDLHELFTRSSLTEDVRVQISSRVAMHYPLMELSIEEVKTIVKHVLGSRATPKVISNLYNAVHGNHRHLDMILPRIAALIDVNQNGNEISEADLIAMTDKAASRLMVG